MIEKFRIPWTPNIDIFNLWTRKQHFFELSKWNSINLYHYINVGPIFYFLKTGCFFINIYIYTSLIQMFTRTTIYIYIYIAITVVEENYNIYIYILMITTVLIFSYYYHLKKWVSSSISVTLFFALLVTGS